MSKKKVISWLLISTLFWMCTDDSPPWREIGGDEAEGNEMVAVAKNLLAKNGNVLSLPDLSKKQVRKGRTRSVSYLTDATPAWAEARNDRRGEEQIVMIPLRGKEEIRSRVCIEREGENSYQFSKTFSRLVVRTKGESTVAHVMTYLPDAAYAESHEAELDTMGYFPGYIQFEGLVLVSSLNGTFLHALLYSKGRIVSKLQAPEEHVHTAACTHEHDGECDHGHEHKTIRLSLNLYSSSSSMTRATYSDGDEKIICSMCGKEDLVCECIVIEGEILYCDKCGAETFNCICGQEDLTKCQTCGNEPCTCHTNPTACPTCGAYPCVCGGSDGGDGEGTGGDGNSNSGSNTGNSGNENSESSSSTPHVDSMYGENSTLTEAQKVLLENALKQLFENQYLKALFDKLGNGVKITFVIDSSINASIQYDAANSKISFIQESSISDIIFREDFIHIVQHNEYYGADMIQENKVNIEFEAKIFWDIASTFQVESTKFYAIGSDAYMECLKDYQEDFRKAYQDFGDEIVKDGYFGEKHYDLYRNALSKWKPRNKEYQGAYNEDFLPEMLEDIFKK